MLFRSNLPRSDTGDDIASYISSYADDRSPSSSPVKERPPANLAAQRSAAKLNDDIPTSSSRRKENSSSKRAPAASGKKADVPFDVIDRLDISGLYGGGGAFLSRFDSVWIKLILI